MNTEGPEYSIVVEVTNYCPNSCPNCFIPNKTVSITAADLKKYLSKIPFIRHSVLIFSGGEPLTHPKLHELADAATEITGYKPFILTSGAIKYNLEPLKNSISGIIVTLKYSLEMFDNAFKGTRGAHEHALSLLQQAKQLNLLRQINWVMDSHNKLEYENMIRTAQKYGAELNILKYIDFSHNGGLREIKTIDFEIIALKARKLGRKLKTNVNVLFPCKFSTGYSCGYGINRLCIKLPDFSVTGCIYGLNTHGSLKKNSWKQIKEKMEEYMLKNYVNKKCMVEEKVKHENL